MRLFIYLFFILLLVACKQNSQEKEILKKLLGKEIKFSDKVQILGTKDSVLQDFLEKDIKILVYTDTLGCTPCKFKVNTWLYYIDQLKEYSNVAFLFYFSQRSIMLEKEFRIYDFKTPIILDSLDSLNKMNNLSYGQRYQTFLLDKQNKIVLVGSPVDSPNIWKLYKTAIDKMIANGGILPKVDDSHK